MKRAVLCLAVLALLTIGATAAVKLKAHSHSVEVVYTGSGTEVPKFAEAAALAECPVGSKVVGVGVSEQTGNLRLISQSIIPELNSASVRMANDSDQFAVFRITVSCVRTRSGSRTLRP